MLSLPRDPLNDNLPDVSSLDWIELAELREAIQRKTVYFHRGDAFNIQRALLISDDIMSYVPARNICENTHILEIGCGQFNPFAISLRFYLNGCSRITASDFSPIYRPHMTAHWTYEAALHAITFPEKWLFDKTAANDDEKERLRHRAYALPLSQLYEGDLSSLFEIPKMPMEYIQIEHSLARLQHSSYDFMYSIAVLEHIMDPATEMMRQYELLRPGGYYFFSVGLEDHRYFENPEKFRPWSFMEDGVYGVDKPIREDLRINGLRSSQYRKLIENAGFQVERWDEQEVYDIPVDLVDKVLPEFRRLPLSDLTTFRLKALIRKPLAT